MGEGRGREGQVLGGGEKKGRWRSRRPGGRGTVVTVVGKFAAWEPVEDRAGPLGGGAGPQAGRAAPPQAAVADWGASPVGRVPPAWPANAPGAPGQRLGSTA